jgi:hypothetical protein
MLLRPAGALAAAAALAVGAAGCGGDDEGGGDTAGQPTTPAERSAPPSETAARPQPVSGGRTLLRVDARAQRALERVGIRLRPIGDATMVGERFAFPISGGELRFTPLTGRIEHRGGLRLSVAGVDLDATNLVMRPGRGVLTAEIEGRRVPLLSFDTGRPRTIPTTDTIVFPAIVTTLNGRAIPGLGDRVSSGLLDRGLRIGHLRTSAKP